MEQIDESLCPLFSAYDLPMVNNFCMVNKLHLVSMEALLRLADRNEADVYERNA